MFNRHCRVLYPFVVTRSHLIIFRVIFVAAVSAQMQVTTCASQVLAPETKCARIFGSSWFFTCWVSVSTYISVAPANPDLVHPCISNRIGVLLLLVLISIEPTGSATSRFEKAFPSLFIWKNREWVTTVATVVFLVCFIPPFLTNGRIAR